MKKIIAVLLFLTLSVLCLSVLPVHGEEGIYDSVIRLHVLANSDGEEDQALKLKVRDAVLARAGELLAEVDTLEEAETVLAAPRCSAILVKTGICYLPIYQLRQAFYIKFTPVSSYGNKGKRFFSW